MTPKKSFNKPTTKEETAFVQAAADGDKATVLEFLDKYGEQLFGVKRVTPSSGALTALGFAALYGRLEVIELLLEKGSPIDERCGSGRTLIFDANREAIKLLVGKGLDIDAKDDRGETALMHEAINGNLKRVQFLIDLGAAVDLKNNDDRTAESLARGVGYFQVAKFLAKWELDKEIADFSPALKHDMPATRPPKFPAKGK